MPIAIKPIAIAIPVNTIPIILLFVKIIITPPEYIDIIIRISIYSIILYYFTKHGSIFIWKPNTIIKIPIENNN